MALRQAQRQAMPCTDAAASQARTFWRYALISSPSSVPVTIYITGLDMRSGQRFLRIEPLPPESDTSALIIQTFVRLQDLLYEDPAAWHFWSEAERFFER